MSKGSSTTTQQTSNAPNPVALQNYYGLLGSAASTAQLPFQTYGGEFTAPVNQQQYAGIGNINQYATAAQPYFQQAGGLASGAAQPLSGEQIQNYYSPYQQQVIQATENQFNNQNAIQQSQLMGNAAAQGALGGNRLGVAQGVLAGQQQLAQAPVIAGLENQGYAQALQTAAQQYQQNPQQAAYLLGNIGQGAQGAGLAGASAQVGAGTLEQQTQQQLDQALYQQFLAQQAYPFQTQSWLAGIDTGVGSQMGGTSYGQTVGPPPNRGNLIGGLGIAGIGALGQFAGSDAGSTLLAGLAAKRGGRISGFADGGMAGMPYGSLGGVGYIPTLQITRGSGPPKGSAPGLPKDDQSGLSQKQIDTASKGLGNIFNAFGSTSDSGDAEPAGLPEQAYSGGRIRGFANAGSVDNDQPVMAGVGTGGSFVPTYDDPSLYGSTPLSYIPPGEVDATDLGPINTDRVRTADANYGPDAPYAQPQLPPEITGVANPNVERMALNYANEDNTPPPVQPGVGAREQGPYAKPKDNGAFWQALMAAGLGMAASRSPFLGVAIGEGGLSGLKTYEGLKERAFNENQAVEKLNLAKAASQRQLDQLEETKRYHTGELAKPVPMYTDDMGRVIYGQRDSKGNLAPIKPPGDITGPTASDTLHGEEYLKTLDPSSAEQVRAIAEGRIAFPTGFAASKPYWQGMLKRVMQYDPSADAINLPSRASTRKDFTSGKSATSLNALNTVGGHLERISDNADALQNTWSPAYNSVANWLLSQRGDPRVDKFNTDLDAVSNELTRAYRGVGGSEADIQSWKAKLNSSKSPAQLHGVIAEMATLLRSKMNALGEQYKQGMGTTSNPIRLVTPETERVFNKIEQKAQGQASQFTGRTATGPGGAKLRETTDGRWVP